MLPEMEWFFNINKSEHEPDCDDFVIPKDVIRKNGKIGFPTNAQIHYVTL